MLGRTSSSKGGSSGRFGHELAAQCASVWHIGKLPVAEVAVSATAA